MNVVNFLRSAIIEASDTKAFTILVDGETQEVSITYAEIDRQAKQIAVGLQRLGLQGERVVLIYPFSLDFIVGLLGCLYSGAIAVLAYPPKPDLLLASLDTVVVDAQAKAVLTSDLIRSMLQGPIQEFPMLTGLHWLASDSLILEEDHLGWQEPLLNEDSPALLSYTSGSTSNPRGVFSTHGNVLANLEPIKKQYHFYPGAVFVFCNPMHHNSSAMLGIASLSVQAHAVLIPTQLVLERPYRWLQTISKYRASISGGFNFLFQLSLQHVSQNERDLLDLTCLKCLGTGGERIDGVLLDRFAEYFQPVGFQKSIFSIGYGLTESSSFAVASLNFHHQLYQQNMLQRGEAVLAGADQKAVVDLVSCGIPSIGKCIIVDPETCLPCASQRVGEVWISGPHVAAGYWQNPEATAEIFQAYMKDTGEGPFLRTGDLGFIDQGELYITGRIKDIIILRGQNYASPDFEQAATGAHPAMVLGGTAALGMYKAGEEHLAIVQELLPDTAPEQYDEITRVIRERITAAFEQPVFAVILVEQGKLPRTMSRKIQRYRCLQNYLDGSLQQLKVDTLSLPTADPDGNLNESLRTPRTPIEGALLGIWMGVLKPETMIGVDDNFFAIGGNSLHAAQVTAHVRDVFQIELPLQIFFEAPTIAGMAQNIEQQRSKERDNDLNSDKG